MAKIWQAPAKALLRAGVHPNAVTITGTIGVVLGAVVFFPKGGAWLFWGTLFITFFVVTDMLDGTMARLSGKTSRLGAFLDSTLDRIADAAIFGALVWTFRDDSATALGALLCLTIGAVVPYARAKAESLGIDAAVGIAERSDRLVIGLTATGLVGLGLPQVVLTVVLWLLAAAAAVTVGQRTWRVVVANRADLDLARDHHRDSEDFSHHPDDAPGRAHGDDASAAEADGTHAGEPDEGGQASTAR
ncbi:CDP-alcohol phosphatidyltransferase family protein [Demequina capsici]|uniref:Phosphatidylinositol phosphate synthase n=1 Tax=Demequina capsici TaxID=3075620 RepID=A0AA96FFA2_9MICO|nr:CDP-alcohol phosphatidyltransferase family protein [Demequina sp. PMTSA13]WNM28637.1 CDP-alcohol phosphatidyltransferase family protein [Demequina sp. PMTSA13]